MSKSILYDFIENFKLARKFVISFQTNYSDHFEKDITIGSLKKFCESVEIKLKESPFGSNVPGRLEGKMENNVETVTIFYSTKLDTLSKINSIVHEIGHWVLLNSKLEIKEQPLLWRETFAKNFSNLICLPFNNRFELIQQLFSSNEVNNIVTIVSKNKVRLKVSLLLKTLNWEIRNDKEYRKIITSDTIWIAVKLSSKDNHTEDSKFRVTSSLYDPFRYFIPENSRITEVLKKKDINFDIAVGEEIQFQSEISLFTLINGSSDETIKKEHRKKYTPKLMPCNVKLLRLKRNNVDNLSTYLFLLKLAPNL